MIVNKEETKTKQLIFGITEAGDASINYEWIEKLETVDGCVLITKNLTDKFIKTILDLKDKPIIIHVSCTGYGQTILEPNCPTYEDTIKKIRYLVDNGWNKDRLVLRIDPIIPTTKGIELFENIVNKSQEIIPEITRIRISVMDMYNHVKNRFLENSLPLPYGNYFQASNEQFKLLDNKVQELKQLYSKIEIESCAETKLPSTEAIGCVSKKDFEILNLKLESEERKGQRKNCLCVCAKKELLSYKWHEIGYNHCYGCLYCYWQTEKDNK